MKSELENILTRNYKKDMIDYIKSNPVKVDELIKLVFEKDNPLSWRASWLLWSCIEPNDERLLQNVSKFIELLPNSNESMQREMLKMLISIDLDENSIGKLINICINIWEDIYKRPGVRFYAMKLLFKISETYQELRNEIVYLLDDRFMKTLSPGIRNSITKMKKDKLII